jgi:hypothetical protein
MPTGGTAVFRAADAMLRALGGGEITLVLPLPTSSNGLASEIGLSDPGVQQLPLFPVAARNLPTPASGPTQRVEFLLSASAVAVAAQSQGAESAQALLDAALGIVHLGKMFHIESTSADCFAGIVYLFRLIGVE